MAANNLKLNIEGSNFAWCPSTALWGEEEIVMGKASDREGKAPSRRGKREKVRSVSKAWVLTITAEWKRKAVKCSRIAGGAEEEAAGEAVVSGAGEEEESGG